MDIWLWIISVAALGILGGYFTNGIVEGLKNLERFDTAKNCFKFAISLAVAALSALVVYRGAKQFLTGITFDLVYISTVVAGHMNYHLILKKKLEDSGNVDVSSK